ncbi:hypothetical protein B0H13DRAFT_2332779 [Mycena leptocephala]|nr:hypothetical protein B0H13DRAFT_2332779 [Mycena leptocephala]
MTGPLDSTYGAWFISLFLETILYGMGILQAWLYFHWYPADGWSTKLSVLLVTTLETVQIVFFFASSYSRFVDHFGVLQTDIIWQDSLQLLANYLSAFAVQIYFANRIRILMTRFNTNWLAKLGLWIIAISTLQCAAALMCDILITLYLCVVLHNAKTGIESTNSMLDTLIVNAINRGMLTALASAFTMVLAGLFSIH